MRNARQPILRWRHERAEAALADGASNSSSVDPCALPKFRPQCEPYLLLTKKHCARPPTTTHAVTTVHPGCFLRIHATDHRWWRVATSSPANRVTYRDLRCTTRTCIGRSLAPRHSRLRPLEDCVAKRQITPRSACPLDRRHELTSET
jgi:hypothetical protein